MNFEAKTSGCDHEKTGKTISFSNILVLHYLTLVFTDEENRKFSRWLEEGYDLVTDTGSRYYLWLETYHSGQINY